jgi:hypothetical protein
MLDNLPPYSAVMWGKGIAEWVDRGEVACSCPGPRIPVPVYKEEQAVRCAAPESG